MIPYRCGKVRGEYFQPVFFLPTKYVLQMPGKIFNFTPARASIPYRSRTIICCPAPQTYRGRKFCFRTLSQRRHLATVLQVAYARTNTMFGVRDESLKWRKNEARRELVLKAQKSA